MLMEEAVIKPSLVRRGPRYFSAGLFLAAISLPGLHWPDISPAGPCARFLDSRHAGR